VLAPSPHRSSGVSSPFASWNPQDRSSTTRCDKLQKYLYVTNILAKWSYWHKAGDHKCSAQTTSANNILVREQWLRQSVHAPSEPPETPWWQITLPPDSIQHVALHIAFQSRFHLVVSHHLSSILNAHTCVGGNSDHTSDWVHWEHACI